MNKFRERQITNQNVFELLYIVAPEFKALVESEYDQEEMKNHYAIAFRLAQYLCDLYSAKDFVKIKQILEYIDSIFFKGDKYTQELAAVGFLEDIQTVLRNKVMNSNDFYQLLLPESKKWWNQVDKFWKGKISFVGETYDQEV